MTKMEDTKYQGWANYQTWNVKLWLDNEQGTYNDMYSYVESTKSVQQLSEWIEDYVQELRYSTYGDAANAASMFTDILNNALANVNWREIAQSYIDDYKYEAEHQKLHLDIGN